MAGPPNLCEALFRRLLLPYRDFLVLHFQPISQPSKSDQDLYKLHIKQTFLPVMKHLTAAGSYF